jgi:hypothetical protein
MDRSIQPNSSKPGKYIWDSISFGVLHLLLIYMWDLISFNCSIYLLTIQHIWSGNFPACSLDRQYRMTESKGADARHGRTIDRIKTDIMHTQPDSPKQGSYTWASILFECCNYFCTVHYMLSICQLATGILVQTERTYMYRRQDII